jgi:hypothetical protein
MRTTSSIVSCETLFLIAASKRCYPASRIVPSSVIEGCSQDAPADAFESACRSTQCRGDLFQNISQVNSITCNISQSGELSPHLPKGEVFQKYEGSSRRFRRQQKIRARQAPIMNHATSVSGVAERSWTRESIG